MINELDAILANILNDSEAPPELRSADKSFVIPKDNYAPALPTINLYLYDLHENKELKQPAPIIERSGNSYIRKLEPLRFNCSYMVTAWSELTEDKQPEAEHKLISQAMQWLSHFPIIPEDLWPANWKDKTDASYQPFPLQMWVAQMDGVKEPGEYWAALGTPPRPFFNLIVTITMALGKKTESEPIPEISTKIIRPEQIGSTREKYLAQFGGRVIKKGLSPVKGIEGASITLVELNRTVKSDKNGYYTFTKIPYGEGTIEDPLIPYTLKAIADNFKVKKLLINMLKANEDYNIELETE